HPEQIDHDQVGEAEVRVHEPGDASAETDHPEGHRVARPVRHHGAMAHGPSNYRLLLAADHGDVDLAAAPHEPIHDGAQEDALPQRADRLADDDLADVAGPSVGEDFVAHGGSGEGHRLRA